MSEDFRRQLYDRFEQEETEELLAIWQENHRYEWSDTAFEVIEEILLERLGSVPPQDEPVFEEPEETPTEAFRQQIYANLNEKDTQELLAIWQANHRYEWSDAAFHILREILLARLGELPPQNEPVFAEGAGRELLAKNALAPGDEVYGDEANQPVCYRPRHVLWLETWLNRAALIIIPLAAVYNLLQLGNFRTLVWSYTTNSTGGWASLWSVLSWLVALLIVAVSTAFEIAIYYFPLKALAAILKILMQMEFNSRPPAADQPAEPAAGEG